MFLTVVAAPSHSRGYRRPSHKTTRQRDSGQASDKPDFGRRWTYEVRYGDRAVDVHVLGTDEDAAEWPSPVCASLRRRSFGRTKRAASIDA